MSRYYDLVIANPVTGDVWKPSNPDGFIQSAGGSTFTSHVNGVAIPGALNIEFEVPSAPFNAPKGSAWIRVWGIGLRMIAQGADLNPDPSNKRPGASILLSAGMKKGLPLANPAQAGLILQGTVLKGFGNWQGVNQTLEMIVAAPVAQRDLDILFHWPAGMSLATALSSTFAGAFGKYATTSIISIANITQNFDEHGHYTSLSNLAAYIAGRSKKLGASTYGDSYSGVIITVTGNTIYAYDSVNPRKSIQLAFQDLIGQPTWINPGTVSFKTVLRSDIAVGDRVKFPPEIVAAYALTTAAAAAPNVPSRSKSAFQGAFNVREVTHYANFRQPDGDSWNTTFTAAALPAQLQNINLLNASAAL